MADPDLSPADLAVLRRCPTTFVHDRRRAIGSREHATLKRLQRLRLIRIVPRQDMRFGAGHMAEIVLTWSGAAALAAAGG